MHTAAATLACWRCGKDVDRLLTACPHCRAPRRGLARRFREAGDPRARPLGDVFTFFAVLLGISVLYGLATSFGRQAGVVDPRQRLMLMFGMELVDTVVVVAALVKVARPALAAPALVAPPLAWLGGALALGLTLAANASYHALLQRVVGSAAPDPVLAGGLTPLVLLVYCVQPAVVEELFFRYVALDTLRSVMGTHAAVAVSCVMFGLAHVGVPLSIPMLALVGVPLAYARVASGGLLLPMAFHFAHNLAIVLRS